MRLTSCLDISARLYYIEEMKQYSYVAHVITSQCCVNLESDWTEDFDSFVFKLVLVSAALKPVQVYIDVLQRNNCL